MLQLFFILIVCIVGSSFFSGSETGFVSWNPLKVSHSAAQGNLSARLALYMMNHKDRFLTTILIGNNIFNVGATLAFVNLVLALDRVVPIDLTRLPSPESWILTPVMVVFGEMLPKTLFRIYSFRLTLKAIPILSVLYMLLLPFSMLLSYIAGLFKRLNLVEGQSYRIKVKEEMLLIAGEGARRGTLVGGADQVINNLLEFKERTVREIAISFDEWHKRNGCLKISQPISEIIPVLKNDEDVVLFDDDCSFAAGYARLIDIASGDKNSVIASITRALPRFEASTTLLDCFRVIGPGFPRYSLCVSESGEAYGVIDKTELIRIVFSQREVVSGGAG
ncbi:Uncharacterized protein CHISP_1367 [Chitinispirillum alkaliphilum]|nr:Uncharacterized protein CHISP_1367 [Chitinispirillum alkaliphilum]